MLRLTRSDPSRNMHQRQNQAGLPALTYFIIRFVRRRLVGRGRRSAIKTNPRTARGH